MSELSPGKYYIEVECAGLNADGGGLAVIAIEPTTDGRIITQVEPSRLHPVPAEPDWEYGVRYSDGYIAEMKSVQAAEMLVQGNEGAAVVRRGPWVEVSDA
jgi:hypothetical protein